MSQRPSWWPLVPILLAGAALAGSAGPAQAKPPSRAVAYCKLDLNKAKQAQKDLRLLEAQKLLARCAQASCGPVRKQCTLRAAQVEADLPSIVFLATDQQGKPLVDVLVSLNGVALTGRLDGRAVPIDPGEHELTFETQSGLVTSEKIVVAQGQRNRQLAVKLQSQDSNSDSKGDSKEPAGGLTRAAMVTDRSAASVVAGKADDPPSLAAKSGGPGVGPYLLGTVGALAIGGYFLAANWRRQDIKRLPECRPDCPPKTIQHIDRLALAANVSLGVGAAAILGAATWWWLGSGSSDDDERQARLDLQLRPSGAVATWAGSF